MKAPQFAKLDLSHAKQMHDLEKLCFSLPWTLKQCASALKQTNFAACGLFYERHLRAYISMYHAADEIEILNLAVHPQIRRHGAGEKLLRIVLQGADKMGIQKTLLEVRESNFPAISLYEKCGFRRCGKRASYYPDTGEDALVYIRQAKS